MYNKYHTFDSRYGLDMQIISTYQHIYILCVQDKVAYLVIYLLYSFFYNNIYYIVFFILQVENAIRNKFTSYAYYETN